MYDGCCSVRWRLKKHRLAPALFSVIIPSFCDSLDHSCASLMCSYGEHSAPLPVNDCLIVDANRLTFNCWWQCREFETLGRTILSLLSHCHHSAYGTTWQIPFSNHFLALCLPSLRRLCFTGFVCLSVCLLATSRKKYWADLREFFYHFLFLRNEDTIRI